MSYLISRLKHFSSIQILRARCGDHLRMLATRLVYGPYAHNHDALPDKKLSASIIVGPKGTVNIAANPLLASPLVANMPAVSRNVLSSGVLQLKSAPAGLLHYHLEPQSPTGSTLYCATEFINKRSRHMGFLRGDNLHSAIRKVVPEIGDALVTVVLEEQAQLLPAVVALARTFSAYSRKTTKIKEKLDRTIYVDFLLPGSKDIQYNELQTISDCVRKCMNMSDSPCSEMDSDTFVAEVSATLGRLLTEKSNSTEYELSLEIIRGKELDEKGFGGIWGVGKGASSPPALCIISRKLISNLPQSAHASIALVGKGIMFDTGGLSLKPTNSMCGMKHDMAGASAVLTAFEAVCLHPPKTPLNLYALLCVAENAIGPLAVRNDDILTMYSGKTVEINNTDAEGRLVLADGVAYASKNLANLDSIVTIATLTGAQMVATGMMHAGVMASTDEAQSAVAKASDFSGDLSFPILYAPELLLQSQFSSEVADLKNSVKERTNAPSSAAGHFIEENINPSFTGSFVHIDIAGPSTSKGRATGYGTTLLFKLVGLLADIAISKKS